MQNSAFVLRSLSLGELLDRAFRLYRRNFLAFIGIVAAPQIPLTLLQFGAAYLMTSAMETSPNTAIFGWQYWGGLIGSLLAGSLQSMVLYGVITSVLTRVVVNEYLGKPVGMMEAFRQIAPKAGKLLGAMLFTLPISLAILIWLLVPCVGWLTGLGMFMAFSWMVLPLLAVVIVLEEFDIVESVKRAWFLSRRRFWWMCGMVTVLSLLSILITAGPAYAISFLLNMLLPDLASSISPSALQQIVQAVVSVFTGSLYMPLYLIVFPLVYFDLRARTEGLDLIVTSAAQNEPGLEERHIAASASIQNEKLFTGSDFGNFAALTLIFLGLYAVIVAIVAGVGLLAMRGFGG